ncbi:CPSF A subunit region-domain-containing protein [Phakopsora pachyrhizi]|nr:CPSF A subunit region-domain-containing protein [Phakopsora pachyrhizi]
MNVIHRQHLAPSGVEYACQLSITPSTLRRSCHTLSPLKSSRPITNLIVARATVLNLYELHRLEDDSQDGGNKISHGPRHRLVHVREHRFHGKVTGLQSIVTLDTAEDGLDRLLISFEDAKMTLMEWSSEVADLVPISLHTFEKLPQLTQGDLPRDYHAELETDPLSRCAVLVLPQSTLAVLPFFQDHLDLDAIGLSASPNNGVDADSQRFQSSPYAPSFILDLNQQLINHQVSALTEISQRPIKSILSSKFLPGFSEPTLAILYQCQWMWSGRLENGIDTTALVILTLDLGSNHFPIISQTQNLPYDAHSLVACPKELGGVLVLCADMILHVDQSSKITSVATNGWVKHTTELKVPLQETVELIKLLVRLENSKILFIKLDTALVFLRDGQIFCLRFEKDGRTLLKLSLKKFAVRSVVPSTVLRLDENSLFVGSMNDSSALITFDEPFSYIPARSNPSITESNDTEKTDMDIDVDDGNESELILELSDSIVAHGSIRDFTMAPIGPNDPMSLELLACTGADDLGGLTIFHREMPLRRQRKLRSSDCWSANSMIQFTTICSDSENGLIEERNLVWISKENNQTDIFLYSDSKEPEPLVTLDSSTIAANHVFEGKFIIQVTQTHIKLLSPDLKEIQVIQPDPPMRIRQAMIMNDYALLQTTSGSVLVYQGNAESKCLSKLPFPSKTPEIRAASFLKADLPTYTNIPSNATFNPAKDSILVNEMNENKDVEMDEKNESINRNQQESGAFLNKDFWLLTTDSEGNFHIHNPKTLEIVFTAKRIDVLPENLHEETLEEESQQAPEIFGVVESPGELEKVVQILAFPTGMMYLRPHLSVMLASGAFAVYELVTTFIRSPILGKREGSPAIFLKKVIGRQFEALEEPEDPSNDGNQKMDPGEDLDLASSWSRSFKPFTVNKNLSGAFFSGPISIWLLSTDHGPCRIYESTERNLIHDIVQLPSGSLITLDEYRDSPTCDPKQKTLWETSVSETVCFDKEVPITPVKIGRPFNKVVYDFPTQTVVGASYLETAFANFDEEGNLIWQPDDDSLIRPTTFRSSLELILPGSWVTIDGYEFQQNEWVTSMTSADLDSRSTVRGKRSFIGVGTTCNRAEDLAARGGVYVFEVIFVNPAENHPERNRALRLRYYEETKACVTALYAKCFEQDERLLAVGFLDIKPYTNCVRVFKNFILLGDAVKGVTLVAFQEEPYKLIELGHTYTEYQCSTVDFIVIDAKLAIVTTDLDGVIRIFEYNPKNVESQAGQKLLCRTEYHTSSEMTSSMQFGKRLSPKDEAKVMGTLFVSIDGSISSIVPAKEAVYKRLQLVQSRLARHIQHFAGLNPRGFRTVRNDMVSRAINRGILDGELLNKFELLSINQQKQISSLAFSDRETVLINLTNLRSLW